jgi:hypothetical protein
MAKTREKMTLDENFLKMSMIYVVGVNDGSIIDSKT